MYSVSRSVKRRRLSASGASVGTQNDVLAEKGFNDENNQLTSNNIVYDIHSHFTRSKSNKQKHKAKTFNVNLNENGGFDSPNSNSNNHNNSNNNGLLQDQASSNGIYSDVASNIGYLVHYNNQENKSTIANVAKQNIKRKISSAFEKVKNSLNNKSSIDTDTTVTEATTATATATATNTTTVNATVKKHANKTISSKKKMNGKGSKSQSASMKKNKIKQKKTVKKLIGSNNNNNSMNINNNSLKHHLLQSNESSISNNGALLLSSNSKSKKKACQTKSKSNTKSKKKKFGQSKSKSKTKTKSKNSKKSLKNSIKKNLTNTVLKNSDTFESSQAKTLKKEKVVSSQQQASQQVPLLLQSQQQQQPSRQHNENSYQTIAAIQNEHEMHIQMQNEAFNNRIRRSRISSFQNCHNTQNNVNNNQFRNTHNIRFNGASTITAAASAANNIINNNNNNNSNDHSKCCGVTYSNQNNNNNNQNNNQNNSNNSNKKQTNMTSQAKYSYDDKGYIVFDKGLILNDRFEMLKPLGKGTFSRVFMCNDLIEGGKKAVKIIRNVDKYQVAARTEAKILQYLRDNDPNDNFAIIHVCEISYYQAHPIFVFPLYGRSLYRFIADNSFQPMPMQHVKSIVKQITKAVAYVHALGVIITDLKPENIIVVDDTANTIVHNGQPYLQLLNPSIKLIDFGSAIFDRKGYHTHLIQTRHYRAPEVMFKFNWSFSADVWSIGCIIVELIYGKMLFNTHDTIDHLNQIITCIGKIPEYMFEMIEDTTYTQLFNYDDTLNLNRAKISPTQCSYLEAYFGLPKNYYSKHLKIQELEKILLQSSNKNNDNNNNSNNGNNNSNDNSNNSNNKKQKCNCNHNKNSNNNNNNNNDAELAGYERINSEEREDIDINENINTNNDSNSNIIIQIDSNNNNNNNDNSNNSKNNNNVCNCNNNNNNNNNKNDDWEEEVFVGAQKWKKSKLASKIEEFKNKICSDSQVLELYDLTRKMLTWDSHERITARNALKHDFFKTNYNTIQSNSNMNEKQQSQSAKSQSLSSINNMNNNGQNLK